MAKSSGPAGTKVTIYDIAKIAGVNPSTVSRALGKPERVSAKTRKLVEQAAAELNFRASPLARSLLTGRTGTVGLIVADITNPSYFDMIRGAQAAAAANGLTLVLAESAESAATELRVARRIQPSTDGIILASPRMSDPEIRALNATKPVTVINRSVAGVDSVVPDVEPGISEAVRHLASGGHRRIAFLAGPDTSWLSARRWECLRSACEWTGREALLIPTTAPTAEGGRRAARDVIASGATAGLCFNDVLAIGLMRELQAAKVTIPDEFSVVGFDNIFGSDFTTPALTTIAAPFTEAGATALSLVLAALPNADDGSPNVRGAGGAELPTSLIVRGSSGRLLGG
ncbi:LacI family DNA-binding transcriptional regulator [Pseudarthrobacter sp. H3Y2-7]|uniref:LacI family DNA-binding transcriptional regulator n=1 Tax=Pseudarthrobacter naphthalenicus TaxID=3031328 RepID=UPI0023AF6684|nr:LacI family DNA-binding transcriptional regulator [Pseudarthrobacter sp. H3Y2-7]MDE8670279.1 LacI family DNA-binding transcriptional regulator [Pseudarthrobacter sp. H3Y2-7]